MSLFSEFLLLLSHVWLFVTHGLQHARLPFIISQSLHKLMSIESVTPPNHLILSCPLLLLQSFPASKWPKYWNFSISFSNECSGLVSFRIDWFDALAFQRTLKSLLQHPNSKTWILWCLAFSIVQLSHLYMSTGKTIALPRWTFIDKVMSLLFNMLSRFV